MPTTSGYDVHGNRKADPLESGRIINVVEQSADSTSTEVWSVPAEQYVSRIVGEQNLTVFERENIGKPVPELSSYVADGTDYTYNESFSNKKRLAARGPNETWTAPQPDDRCGLNAKDPMPNFHPNNIPRSTT